MIGAWCVPYIKKKVIAIIMGLAAELIVKPTSLCTINYEHTIIYKMDKCLPYTILRRLAINDHCAHTYKVNMVYVGLSIYIMRCFNVCNYLMRCHKSLNFDVMKNLCAMRSSTFDAKYIQNS